MYETLKFKIRTKATNPENSPQCFLGNNLTSTLSEVDDSSTDFDQTEVSGYVVHIKVQRSMFSACRA
jgi:hypothetical protein